MIIISAVPLGTALFLHRFNNVSIQNLRGDPQVFDVGDNLSSGRQAPQPLSNAATVPSEQEKPFAPLCLSERLNPLLKTFEVQKKLNPYPTLRRRAAARKTTFVYPS
ncbi:hypothetical protein LV85_04044 [Algoriphagus chordae]|uniref:Uncharacterized protein n=1 Tax=Algoriphagus chordae TaxID=237019 RepID=A0A2W7QID5_9BACT|nr:hypothetical protein LV85_04044 [Algoriphagus chordae]